MKVLTFLCVAQQGHAAITVVGSVCNLEQRLFESLVSYTPGFAMPCLTGCSVCFMSLSLVRFQSILGLCNCRRCWYAPQSLSFALTLDSSDHTGKKRTFMLALQSATCLSLDVPNMKVHFWASNAAGFDRNTKRVRHSRTLSARKFCCLVLLLSRWGHT